MDYMKGEGYSFEELLNNFFTDFEATAPENAGNYNDLPTDNSAAGEKDYNEVEKSY